KSIGSRSKGRAEGIAHRLEHDTLVGCDGGTQEGIMPSQGRAHGLWELLPEFGAALDVGKEKGDGSVRQVHSAPGAGIGHESTFCRPMAVLSPASGRQRRQRRLLTFAMRWAGF